MQRLSRVSGQPQLADKVSDFIMPFSASTPSSRRSLAAEILLVGALLRTSTGIGGARGRAGNRLGIRQRLLQE